MRISDWSSDVCSSDLAGVDLQNVLQDARVIYASATGATDVHNLAYATRIGMWGAETCFDDRLDFIRTFEQGGIADLEQVTLSMKAAVVYVARALSFAGVATRYLYVTLSINEHQIYTDAHQA